MSLFADKQRFKNSEQRQQRSLGVQLLLSLALVLLATFLTAWIKPFAEQLSYAIYYAAVLIACLYGGLAAGIITTVVSGLVGNFLFVEPIGHLFAATGDTIQTITFWVVAASICTLIFLRQRSEERLHERDRFIENLAATAPYTLYLYDVPNQSIDYVTPEVVGQGPGPVAPVLCLADPSFMHPEDRVRYMQHLSDLVALPDDSVVTFQYRSHADDGTWRWCERQERVYDRLQGGAVNHVLGVVQDITERKQAQDQVRYQSRLIDMGAQAIVAVDTESRVTLWNKYAEEMYGWPAAEVVGKRITKVFGMSDEDEAAAETINARVLKGQTWSGEFTVPRRNGTLVTVDIINAPIYDEQGAVVGFLGTAVDNAERKRAETYLRFLSDASLALSSSLDYKMTIQRVAELAVPRFADWCSVDLLRPGGSVELVAVAHVNPDRVQWAQELRRRTPPDLQEDQGLAKVIKTGESEFYPSIPEELIAQQDLDEEELAILREINMRSVIIVPLRAREQIMGALTLVWSESDRNYTPSDLVFAEELANRAAIAVDNARLYEDARIAEQQQAELLAQMEALVANAPIGIAFMDRELRYVRVNEAMARMNGLPAEAHLEHRMEEVLPHLTELTGPFLRQVLETGEPILNYEVSGRSPGSDDLRHVLVSWYPVLGEQGKPLFVGTIVVDITERKRFETALRESEERFRATFEQAAVGISHVGLDGRWLRVNNRLCEISGYSRDEMLQMTFQELTYPGDLPDDLQLVENTIAGEIEGYRLEKRYQRKDGVLIWVNLTVSLVRNVATGEPLYFISVVEDISLRKASETQLLLLAEASQVLFPSLADERTLQAAADLLVPRLADWCVINLVNDGDGSIEPVAIAHRNPAKTDLLRELVNQFPLDDGHSGGTPEVIRTGRPYFLAAATAQGMQNDLRLALLEQVGLASLIIVPLQARAQTFGSISLARSEPSHAYHEGDLRFAEELAQRIALAVDNAGLYASALRAETQLRQLNETLEERVRERTQELERSNRELDRFAYIASHDLKAPLRAIDNLSTWLEQDVQELLPAPSQEHLSKLRGRVRRMERLLDDLLAYSRAGRVQHDPQLVETGPLVRSIFDLQAPPPSFKLFVEEPMPVMHTQRVPLETVLRNLIGNAVKHHHRPDGEVRVSARVLNGEEGKVGMVEFCVCDDGPGIAQEYHTRIFELFQTLLPRDQLEGSGMGLAIVKKTVESAGGQIVLRSAPGAGTCFCFTWPSGERNPESDLNEQIVVH